MNAQEDTSDGPDREDQLRTVPGGIGLRDEFLLRLQGHQALPFLFMGSGLSRRYLGLPDWEGMLRRFSEDIDTDFDFLLASARGDLPQAAGMLAKEFHPVWFKEPRYSKERAAYKNEVRDDEAALKVSVAEYMTSASTLREGTPGVDDPSLASELALLGDAVVDGVITTNYDTLSDQVFPKLAAYVGQDELLLSDAQFVGEVYKIHGSCDSPKSLVLTDRDYKDFTDRNAYLAAKLLTIFAEHPVIFLGYSLSDQYIRQIIESIAKAVGPSRLSALEERIYFIEWSRDPSLEPIVSQYFLEVAPGQSLPVTKIETYSFLPLFNALTQLSRPFPAQLLRELRKHVYDLVTHPNPDQSREVVRTLPIDSDDHGDLRVVFGIGQFSDQDVDAISAIGFRALTRSDLAEDILGIGASPLDALNVLRVALPGMLRSASSAYLPVMKYANILGLIDDSGAVTTTDLPESVTRLISRTPAATSASTRRFDEQYKGILTTPRAIFDANLATYYKFDALLCLDPATYDLEELRQVLIEQMEEQADATANIRTHLFKAIAHYDRLRWGARTLDAKEN